jgi:hypothetical protein
MLIYEGHIGNEAHQQHCHIKRTDVECASMTQLLHYFKCFGHFGGRGAARTLLTNVEKLQLGLSLV